MYFLFALLRDFIVISGKLANKDPRFWWKAAGIRCRIITAMGNLCPCGLRSPEEVVGRPKIFDEANSPHSGVCWGTNGWIL